MLDIISVPFGYLMRFCYMITNNYALALILFTIFFKLILLPLNIKQHKSSQAQARVRPKERAIRKRYEGRTDEYARVELSNELMKLYKEEKVSVAGGCLPLLIQLPIIMALYNIVTAPLTYLCRVSSEAITALKTSIYALFEAGTLTAENTSAKLLDLFKSSGALDKFNINELQIAAVVKNNPAQFTEFLQNNTLPDFTIFGGSIDLSATPVLGFTVLALIPILVGLFQFASTVVIQKFTPQPDTSNASPEAAQTMTTMKTMNIVMPLMTVFFAFNVPAILGLYWIYQSIFSAGIQIALTKLYPIPTYTPEEYEAIEAEMNKDFVPPKIEKKASAKRSLHHIDDEDDIYLTQDDDSDEDTEDSEEETDEPAPARRRFDKDGNKIRSLHFIDEEDESDNGDEDDSDSESSDK